MENCLDYLELMNAVLDGEAAPECEKALEAHLAVCPSCAALYRDLSALREGADGLLVQAPKGFTARVMSSIRAQAAPRKQVNRRWRGMAAMAAVCTLALLGAGGLKYFQSQPAVAPTPPAVERAVSGRQAETTASVPPGGAPAGDAANGAVDRGAGVSPSPLPEETGAGDNAAAQPDAAPKAALRSAAAFHDETPTDVPEVQAGNYLTAGASLFAFQAPQEDAASLRQALESVVEYTSGGSGYTMETAYAEDPLSCDVRLLDGDILMDESRVVYTGLSENGKYYCFRWDTSCLSMDYAVPLDGSSVLWEGDTADGGESFRAALQE